MGIISVKNCNKIKRFADNDLVYGPSANGKLRLWCKDNGGKLLSDLEYLHDDSIKDWVSYSLKVLDNTLNSGSIVHFDLTHMENILEVLNNKGKYAKAVTSVELRYICMKWNKFKNSVIFYKNDLEVDKPW